MSSGHKSGSDEQPLSGLSVRVCVCVFMCVGACGRWVLAHVCVFIRDHKDAGEA